MSAVFLAGYYGFGNFGDEILRKVFLDQLTDCPEIDRIYVLSAPSANHPRVEYIPRNPFRIIRALTKSDLFIMGGGGIFQDKTSSASLYYYMLLVLLARLLSCRIVLAFQGIGPISSNINQRLFSYMLRLSDYISVRDTESGHLLHPLTDKQVHVYDDPSLLAFEGMPRPVSDRILGLNLRHVNGFDYRQLADTINKIVEQNQLTLRIFEAQHYEKSLIAGFVPMLNKAPEVVVVTADNYRETFACDYLIAMRLHLLILAFSSQIPAIGITYDDKVAAFCRKAGFAYIHSAGELGEKFTQNKKKSKYAVVDLKGIRQGFTDILAFADVKKTSEILGVRIDRVDYSQLGTKVVQYLGQDNVKLIFTPNPEIIYNAVSDEQLRNTLNSGDLNLPDGIGVLLASRILGCPLHERITGIDSFLYICRHGVCKKAGIYLLGSRPGITEKAAANLRADIPGIVISGWHDGYFKDDEEVIQLINNSGAKILFVGLGSPRQEKWLADNRSRLRVRVAMVIGGTLDVVSGDKKRAPEFFINLHIEWLYRFIQEPWRYKRLLILPRFVWAVVRSRLFPHR